jgi:hypothetical protein
VACRSSLASKSHFCGDVPDLAVYSLSALATFMTLLMTLGKNKMQEDVCEGEVAAAQKGAQVARTCVHVEH